MKAKIHPLPKAGPAPRQRFDTAPKIPTIAMACVLAGAACITTFIPYTAHAQEAVAQQSFNIPAGKLSDVLARFAAAAGVPLSFEPQMLGGRESDGLEGHYSVQEGFGILLAGSGYQLVSAGSGGYALQEISANTTTLPSVRVSGDFLGTTTEGTGSYTTNAVTLFKGTTSLKDIPQSVSVMTREQLDDQGITRLEDAYNQMPGVRMNGYADVSRIFVRGFEAETLVDGIRLPGRQPYQLDPVIYDRVEMLRGPSGLLSGSGEPGGVVNLVRKRPLDEYALSGSLSYASWNDARAELDVSNVLNDSGTLRGRVVGAFQDRDFFYEAAHETHTVLYGILEYDLTPQDTVTLSITRQETDNNIFWGLPRYSDGSLPDRDSFTGVTDYDSMNETSGIFLDYKRQFENGWEASVSTQYQDEDYIYTGIYTAPEGIDINTGLTDTNIDSSTQTRERHGLDLYLSGPFKLWGRDHHATLGYNYSNINSESPKSLFLTIPNADVLNQHKWGISLNDLQPWGNASEIEQSGFYGSVNLRVLDPLSLILGAQISDYNSKSRSDYNFPWVDQQESDSEFTPYAGLIWNLNPHLSMYASYAEIYVPQSEMDHTETMLEPRVGEQYEVGIKSSFLHDRLNTSLAVYQLRDENRATQDPDTSHVCPWVRRSRCYIAAGEIQTRGFEAEVAGAVTANLKISASYTYNRTTYLNDADPDNVGERFDPDRHPEHQFKLWAQYRDLDTTGDWTLGGGLVAQSKIYEPYTGFDYEQGSYSVVSMNAGYRFNTHLDLMLYIDNIFDRTYLEDIGTNTYFNQYGESRSFGLTLSGKF